MTDFLILSLLSGIIELGSVYLGICQGLPLPLIVSLPLFYQVGNFLLHVFPQRVQITLSLAGIVCLLSIAYLLSPSFIIIIVQMVLSSYCIQFARSQYKSSCPTWLKRSFRVAGFALSPAMCWGHGQVVLLLCMALCIAFLAKKNFGHIENILNYVPKVCKSTKISLIMIFHQMHYFVYTYIMPLYIYQKTGSILISSALFAFTWVIYLLPQTFADKFRVVNYRKLFFFCHSFLGICMGMMTISAYFDSVFSMVLFWILTGLGGGSVFCIAHLTAETEAMNMDLSENIGHIVGPLCAVIVCFASNEETFVILPALSLLFVLLTLVFAAYAVYKEKSNGK